MLRRFACLSAVAAFLVLLGDNWAVGPISAEVVTKGFAELLNQPPRVLDAMNKYLKVGGG